MPRSGANLLLSNPTVFHPTSTVSSVDYENLDSNAHTLAPEGCISAIRPFTSQPLFHLSSSYLYDLERLPPTAHLPIISLESANLSSGVLFSAETRAVALGSVSQISPRKLPVFRTVASRFLKTTNLRVNHPSNPLKIDNLPQTPYGGVGGGVTAGISSVDQTGFDF